MLNVSKIISKGAIGEFKHKNTNCYFTYSGTKDEWELSHGLISEIDVLDGIRYGIVKKTVAHVAVGEDENGKPIIEIWDIKRHHKYTR